MRIIKFFHSFYKSILVFLLILIASTIPADEVQEVSWLNIPDFDKIVHFGMYFLFSFVLIYDFLKSKPALSTIRIYMIAALFAVVYGGSLELIQAYLLKSRSGDIIDFLFNTAGVVLAALLWMILKKPK